MRTPVVLLSSLVFGAFLACGGGNPDPKTAGPESSGSVSATASAAPMASSAEPSATASATASAPPVASASTKSFDSLSPDEQKNLMKTVVIPKMGELFKGHDAKKFKDFGCKTCHGAAGVKDGKYKMPNPALPKLSWKDKFKKHMDKSPEMTKFMMDKVLPEMQTILGMGPFDPKTKTGFGCGGCHVME